LCAGPHGAPPVIDGADLLADPPGLLAALCQRLEIPFEEAMLSWEPGPRETDGCWAAVWYQRVAASTGFAPRRAPRTRLDPGLEPLLARCQPLYDQLHAQRLGAA